jgi:hypothetical protein
MDFDDDSAASSPKGVLRHSANDAGSTNQFGMFAAAKPRTRSQQKIMANLPNDSQSMDKARKRKYLGMFSHDLPAKRDKADPCGRDRIKGERLARNTDGTYHVDLGLMDDDEEIFVKSYSTAVELKTGTRGATISNSGLGQATRERSTTSSLTSPPSSLIYDSRELEDVSIRNEIGTINIQDGSESMSLDEQAQMYLKMEAIINNRSDRIAMLEMEARCYLLKQTALEKHTQWLDQASGTAEKRLKDEAMVKKEEAQKRFETEKAAIDEAVGRTIALDTANMHEEKIAFARTIEEIVKLRQEDEEKIRKEQYAVTKTRESLQALKKAGGFDLGEVVNAMRQ